MEKDKPTIPVDVSPAVSVVSGWDLPEGRGGYVSAAAGHSREWYYTTGGPLAPQSTWFV